MDTSRGYQDFLLDNKNIYLSIWPVCGHFVFMHTSFIIYIKALYFFLKQTFVNQEVIQCIFNSQWVSDLIVNMLNGHYFTSTDRTQSYTYN